MITNIAESKQKLGYFFTNNPSLTELSVPELTRLTSATYIPLVINNSNLQKINLPFLEQSPHTIAGINLRELILTNLKYFITSTNFLAGSYYPNLISNTKLESLVMPNFYGTTDSSLVAPLQNNYWLHTFDIGSESLEAPLSSYYFGANWLINSYFLTNIILRYPYVLPANSNLTFINSSPFSTVSPYHSQSYIFVPDNLVESYTTANRWSVNALATQFRPLSTYDTYKDRFADTLTKSWAEIIDIAEAFEQNPSASLDSIRAEGFTEGMTKTIYIDGCPTQLVLAGIRQDYLSGSSVPATFTWVEKTLSRFNTIDVYSNTYNMAGAENLNIELTRLYDKMDSQVKTAIKEVNKIHYSGSSSSIEVTTPKIWIPSPGELIFSAQRPQKEGVSVSSSAYEYFLQHNNPYYFGRSGDQPLEANAVALRGWGSTSKNPYYLSNSGNSYSQAASGNRNHYLIIGFCI